jgi:hypothetical protein
MAALVPHAPLENGGHAGAGGMSGDVVVKA